jgi:dCTP deaminase
MILSDGEIKEALAQHKIVIDPLPIETQYNASSVDLTFGTELFRLKTIEEIQQAEPQGSVLSIAVDPSTIDIHQFLKRYGVPIPLNSAGYFSLEPKTFALGTTREFVGLPKKSKIAGRVEGRSTLARLGLTIHMTAPTIHCSFEGTIILEMYNFGAYPIQIRPQMTICQLILERLTKAPLRNVATSFQGQKGVMQ